MVVGVAHVCSCEVRCCGCGREKKVFISGVGGGGGGGGGGGVVVVVWCGVVWCGVVFAAVMMAGVVGRWCDN
jgi:hypothetical protein